MWITSKSMHINGLTSVNDMPVRHVHVPRNTLCAQDFKDAVSALFFLPIAMPKYIPLLPFEDCYGSVGNLTYYHRDRVCYIRKRPRPQFPGTRRQLEHMHVHLRAMAAWRHLSNMEQEQWNGLAVGVVSHRPPFDGKSGISGNNLFISAYHGFFTLGQEHIPSPAPFERFPSFLVTIQGATAQGGALCIRLRLDVEDPDGRYRLLTKVQLASPGRGLCTGELRNYLAEGTANDAAVITRIPNYISICGLDLPSYQVHARCILLDTKTGYRSQYLQVSGVVSL